jgi:hypothetical protein
MREKRRSRVIEKENETEEERERVRGDRVTGREIQRREK